MIPADSPYWDGWRDATTPTWSAMTYFQSDMVLIKVEVFGVHWFSHISVKEAEAMRVGSWQSLMAKLVGECAEQALLRSL